MTKSDEKLHFCAYLCYRKAIFTGRVLRTDSEFTSLARSDSSELAARFTGVPKTGRVLTPVAVYHSGLVVHTTKELLRELG